MSLLIVEALLGIFLAVSFNYFRARRNLPIDLWWVHSTIISALFLLAFLEQQFKATGTIYVIGCVLGALSVRLMIQNFRENPESSIGHFHYIPLYKEAIIFFSLGTVALFILSQFLWALQALQRGRFF